MAFVITALPSFLLTKLIGKNLENLAGEAARRGVKLGEVIPGSRKRPDGVVLSWRYTDPRTVVGGGVVPFFIDWGTSAHPSSTATPGASLVSLRAEHPQPDQVRKTLDGFGLDLPVTAGFKPALVATVSGPRGRVELR